MCQYCGPNNHGRSQEKNGNHIGISRTRVSSLLFWYNDTFACEFSWRIAYSCSSPHMMDVPCRALHEDIKRLCEKQSKTRRKYNKKLCHQRSSRNLYKYLQEFTFTKRRVWDDKEYPSMFYEMLEGIGSTQIMNVDLQDMSHSFCFKMWSWWIHGGCNSL